MIQISIPQPCHEKWDAMALEDKGRFCGACQKIVVDFSAMTDDEVKNYLFRNAHQKTCGRFLVSQINRPLENKPIEINPYWYAQLPYAHQIFYAIALFFVLGVSSCTWGVVKTNNVLEKPADTVFETTLGVTIPEIIDDTATFQPSKGKIYFTTPTPIKSEELEESNVTGLVAIEGNLPNKKIDTPIVKIEEPIIMGDVQMGAPTILDSANH